MAGIQKQPASITISNLVDRLTRVLSSGTRKVEQVNGNEYSLVDTGIMAVSVKAPFVQMNMTWFKDLEKGAVSFVILEIIPQIKMYNMLWHRPRNTTNGRELQIMADLKKAGIILPTETTDIYLINPFMIWRGSIPGVILATKSIINGCAPELSMLIDLRAPRRSELKTLTELAAQAIYNANNNEISDV